MTEKKETIQGFNIDLITFNEAIDVLVSKAKAKQGIHVVTINPEIIESAKKDKELKEIINNAGLVLADGTGIKIALNLKGKKQERIPGIDLAYELLRKANEEGLTVSLIGANQNVLEKAQETLKNNFKDIKIVYSHNGYFSNEEEYILLNKIALEKPNIVLVALGSPKQEFFIKKCLEDHPTAIYIGVGGSFDVWSGNIERAPEFYRTMGLEWLYRTFKQPQRLKRICKTLPLFAVKAIMEAVKYKYFCEGDNNGKTTKQ